MLLIIGVVLAVSGIVGFYIGVRASDRAMSQTAWLKAPGSVIGAEVRYDGEMYVSVWPRPMDDFRPRV